MAQKENKLILYKDEEGKLSVNTLFADEDVWLTQAQLVEVYQSSKSNISEHLTNIFADKELDKDAVVRKFRTTATDGKNYLVQYYNLDCSAFFIASSCDMVPLLNLKSIVSAKCDCWKAISTKQ